MYYPTIEEVRHLRDAEIASGSRGPEGSSAAEKAGRPLLPLCCDILADLETPVSAYCKASQGPYSFLLESVTGGERIGRYSFIGIDPYMIITHHGDRATIYRTDENMLLQGEQQDGGDPRVPTHPATPPPPLRGETEHEQATRGETEREQATRDGGDPRVPTHPATPPPPLRGEREREQAIRGEMERGEASRTDIPCHDPLELVEAELGQYRLIMPASISHDELPRFHGGAVGYLSYEAAARFEHLPVPEKNELGLPLAVFCFTETVLVFDHVKHRARIVTHVHLDAPDVEAEYQRGKDILDTIQRRLRQPVCLPDEPAPLLDTAALQVTSNRTQSEFEEMVRRSIAYIKAGDVFQVVPSQRLSRSINAAPFTVYRALRAINPSPYMFFLDLHDFHIVGASPELLVRFEDNEVTIRPIAGTRPRGADRSSDEGFAKELKNDPKERAEHVMLVDLARNDVGRVSVPGSIHVSELMDIERYSHVMHLVSNITGQLREDVTPYDALRAGFPAGTVSGAPKIRAMEIISELEGEQRGVYAGAVGYFSYSHNQETAIALRTMVIKDGRASIQAGCGVVADSDPTAEYHESLNKARALLRALDEAEFIANEHRRGTLLARSGELDGGDPRVPTLPAAPLPPLRGETDREQATVGLQNCTSMPD